MNELTLLVYGLSCILFIVGLKMLGRQGTARKGNLISAVGMALAVGIALFDSNIEQVWPIALGLAVGSVWGVVSAARVAMTGMPELVALLNGLGGLSSLLVGIAEFQFAAAPGTLEPGLFAHWMNVVVVASTISIGGVTFSGSLLAMWKLAESKLGVTTTLPAHRSLFIVIGVISVGVTALMGLWDEPIVPTAGLVFLSLAFGVLVVLPIGGGDMPVVIALLNSLSGVAASAAGFVLNNTILVVAGCLVGASGVILTLVMCKAMNRNLASVLLPKVSTRGTSGGEGTAESGELKPIAADAAYFLLEAARSVVFVPGYGMAVAQAQHSVKELAALLEDNGADVQFAIHPVAGRMPGHMNVLLAEADVSYDQLAEMDQINPRLAGTDVVVVIGANDVVNPAAVDNSASPIYGMPIIRAHEAKSVLCLKRGAGKGFAGLENALFLRPNTRMLFGDAKHTLQALVSAFKGAA